MIQLLTSWVCENCNPSDNTKKKKTANNKEPSTEDECVFPQDDQWNGWEYADDKQIPIGIAVSAPDPEDHTVLVMMTGGTARGATFQVSASGPIKTGDLLAIHSSGYVIPYKKKKLQ